MKEKKNLSIDSDGVVVWEEYRHLSVPSTHLSVCGNHLNRTASGFSCRTGLRLDQDVRLPGYDSSLTDGRGRESHPSVHLSIRVSIYPSVNPSARPSIRPAVHTSIRPSIRLSVRSHVNPSVHLSPRTSEILSFRIQTSSNDVGFWSHLVGLSLSSCLRVELDYTFHTMLVIPELYLVL